MRAVVDTNIFLAGLLSVNGGAAKIIRAFRDHKFELVVTPEVFEEYVRVIHLLDNAVPPQKSEELLELVFARAIKVRAAPGRGLCTDGDDEKFLSAAFAGNATLLVTKNKKHFPKDVVSLKIVNIRGFLLEIERRGKRN